MNSEKENPPLLLLYLNDEEVDADSGFGNDLILTISLTMSSTGPASKSISLSRNEIVILAQLGNTDIRKCLFAMFGQYDLRTHPGYPKGPFYSVDEDVYEAIEKLVSDLGIKCVVDYK